MFVTPTLENSRPNRKSAGMDAPKFRAASHHSCATPSAQFWVGGERGGWGPDFYDCTGGPTLVLARLATYPFPASALAQSSTCSNETAGHVQPSAVPATACCMAADTMFHHRRAHPGGGARYARTRTRPRTRRRAPSPNPASFFFLGLLHLHNTFRPVRLETLRVRSTGNLRLRPRRRLSLLGGLACGWPSLGMCNVGSRVMPVGH